MEKIERDFKRGEKFKMTGLNGEIKPVEIINVSENCVRVICGSEKATMPIELLKHLDRY